MAAESLSSEPSSRVTLPEIKAVVALGELTLGEGAVGSVAPGRVPRLLPVAPGRPWLRTGIEDNRSRQTPHADENFILGPRDSALDYMPGEASVLQGKHDPEAFYKSAEPTLDGA